MIQVVDRSTGQVLREFCTYGEAVVFRRDVLGSYPSRFEIRGVARSGHVRV